MKPVISSSPEEMHTQIGSNHFPTLRQLPEGWVLDIQPDRMPMIVTALGVASALLFAMVLIWQVLP